MRMTSATEAAYRLKVVTHYDDHGGKGPADFTSYYGPWSAASTAKAQRTRLLNEDAWRSTRWGGSTSRITEAAIETAATVWTEVSE